MTLWGCDPGSFLVYLLFGADQDGKGVVLFLYRQAGVFCKGSTLFVRPAGGGGDSRAATNKKECIVLIEYGGKGVTLPGRGNVAAESQSDHIFKVLEPAA